MQSSERADILIEAIEVLINQILYIRDVYPEQIFKKRRIYNCPIYVSIFPPLNTYVHNVLRSAKELLSTKNNLKCLELALYTGDCDIFEQHNFELADLSKAQDLAGDEFLLQFEEEIRKCLYQMPERMKVLSKLPNDTKMTIRLHTSQVGHVQLGNNVDFQDFPWIQADCESAGTSKAKRWYILPVAAVHGLGLNLTSEVK